MKPTIVALPLVALWLAGPVMMPPLLQAQTSSPISVDFPPGTEVSFPAAHFPSATPASQGLRVTFPPQTEVSFPPAPSSGGSPEVVKFPGLTVVDFPNEGFPLGGTEGGQDTVTIPAGSSVHFPVNGPLPVSEPGSDGLTVTFPQGLTVSWPASSGLVVSFPPGETVRFPSGTVPRPPGGKLAKSFTLARTAKAGLRLTPAATATRTARTKIKFARAVAVTLPQGTSAKFPPRITHRTQPRRSDPANNSRSNYTGDTERSLR